MALQELASLLSIVRSLLVVKDRQLAGKGESRVDILLDLLKITEIQKDFSEKIFDQVNYDPGNSDYVHLRTQMMNVMDAVVEIAIRWNVVKLPAGAGRFSSWEGSA